MRISVLHLPALPARLTSVNLAKTPSNASSASSVSALSRATSAGSTANLAAATMSNVSLVGTAAPVNYKSYEHHLRPTRPPSPPASSRRSPSTMDIVRKHTHTHRHRTHHSRHFREPPAIQQFSMHDLSADVVIEAVFNPHAANEDTPFTYVPDRTSGADLEGPQAVLEGLFSAGQGAGGVEGGEGGVGIDGEREAGAGGGKGGKWAGLRGMRGRREKRDRAASNLSQVQGRDFVEKGHGAMGMERTATAGTIPTTAA